MSDYDKEAGRYDRTRGGEVRAAEAAAAVESLLPRVPGMVVDVAGGTGIVSAVLAKLGRDVVVCDLSEGMLRAAQRRLPRRVVQSDAARMPFGDASVCAVVMVWLLHLLDDRDDMDMVVREAVRVLSPGGRLLTTVDKAASHGVHDPLPADASADIEARVRAAGAVPVARTTFVGVGQARPDEADPVFTLRAFEKIAR